MTNIKSSDKTRSRRQAKRREQLNQKAKDLGFASWARFETLVLHGLRVEIHREHSVSTNTNQNQRQTAP